MEVFTLCLIKTKEVSYENKLELDDNLSARSIIYKYISTIVTVLEPWGTPALTLAHIETFPVVVRVVVFKTLFIVFLVNGQYIPFL